jgi:hypothetical protein
MACFEPRLKIGNPRRQALHLCPERPDQGVLLAWLRWVEVGKLRHAFV